MENEGDLRCVDSVTEIYWCGNWTPKWELPHDWKEQSDCYRLEQRKEQELRDRLAEQKAFAQWLDCHVERQRLNDLKRQIFQALKKEMDAP